MFNQNPPFSFQKEETKANVPGKLPNFNEVKNTEFQVKKSIKNPIIFFIICICLFILAVVFVWFFIFRESNPVTKIIPELKKKETIINKPAPIDWTADWPKYLSERYGIEFKYPIETDIIDNDQEISIKKNGQLLIKITKNPESLQEFLSRYIVKGEKVDNSKVIPGLTDIGGKSAMEVTVKTEEGKLLTCEFIESFRLNYEICIYSDLTEEVKQILGTIKFL
jgi:hypothetical protein